jgi:LmbE family N-acetylglucosaminyl deacetylase
MNILAIGAHPDDVELGCGGLLLKAAKNGHNVFVYTLTKGAASGDPYERTRELKYSADFIGVKISWIDDFEDTKLSLDNELINHIEFIINKSKADIVYTHSLSDTHHDHRAVAAATIEAGRLVNNILSYENSVTKDFKPQVYYDITDVIEDKIELINLFITQKDKMFLQSNAIKGLAQYRALQSRMNTSITSVEAFEVIKLSFTKNFNLIETLETNQFSNKINSFIGKEIIEYIPKKDKENYNNAT